MKITISGKVLKVTPVETIPSKNGGNPFVKRTLIIDDSYKDRVQSVAIDFGGEKADLLTHIVPDMVVTVEAYLNSREYNGKYFNSISGSSVTVQNGQQPQNGQSMQQFSPQQSYQQSPAGAGYSQYGYQQPQPYSAPTPGFPPYQQQAQMFQ